MSKSKKIQETKRGLLDTSNDDFESPIVFKKFKQPSKNATTTTKRIKTKRANNKKQLTLHQVYDENFRCSDMNPEHLQLALALSRSTSEIHNCNTNEEFPLTSQTEGKKRTLLEFGFKTNRPKMSVDNKILKKEPLKTNKKSKYRYITPILMMRTEEERESLIQTKLSSIFIHNINDSVEHENFDIEVSSEELQNIRCTSCSIFNLCTKNLSQEEQLRVSHLNIEGTRAKSGSLLKDWKKIPLRDHTPERTNLDNSTCIPEISTTVSFKKGETSENMSPQTTDLDSEKFNSLEVGRNCESSKSSILSIDHKYGAVSPDLFDDASFSEDFSSLHDVSNKVRKKLSNIFAKEDMGEKTSSSNFRSDFNNEDEKHEVHTSHNPEKITENQYVEGNSQQSVSTSSKSNFQEFFRNDCSHVPDAETIVLSSDEELAALETNSFRLCSEAKNSFRSLNDSVPCHKENSHEISTDRFDSMKNKSSEHEKSESDKKSKNLYCLDDENIDLPSMDENMDEKTENLDKIVVSSDEEYLNKDQLSNNDSFRNSVGFFDEESKISKPHTSDKPDLSKLSSSFHKYDSTSREDLFREKGSDGEATNFTKDIHNILGKSSNDSLGEKSESANELRLSAYFHKYDLKEGPNEQNNSFGNSSKSISPEKHNSSGSRTKYDEDILYSSYRNENVENDNFLSSNSEISDLKGHDKLSDSSYNSLNLEDTNYKFSDTFDEYLPEIPKSVQVRFSENSSHHKLYTSSPAQEPKEKCDSSDFKLDSLKNEDEPCQNPTSLANRISGICENPEEIFSDTFSDSILDKVFKENSVNSGNYNYDSKMNLHFESDTENKNFLCDELPKKQKKEDKYINLSNSSLISNESIDQQINVDVNIQSVQKTPDKNLKQTPNTLFRRYASFSQTETPKSSVAFMRHKSESNITPNNKFIIKTENVTPMVDYNAFSTPEIVKELGKFGLKPLKRKRGINLLKHIYETTHPKVEMTQKETEEMPIIKRRKSNENQIKAVDNISTYQDKNGLEMLRGWSDSISDSDAIFERRPSSKLPTCQVPLQIVWHNFLSENPQILENILLYEPLQVEVIHKMIKDVGYKFHMEDLISFFDQKCITIRVAQNNRAR